MTIEPQYVWLVVGITLIIAEVTMGNFILLFLGGAAVVVGIALSMGMPSTGGLAYYLFAALSVVLLLGVRSRMGKIVVGDIAKGSDDEDFIGHNAVVESGFDDPSPTRGRVVYRGASWDAVSKHACQQVGAVLLIVGREGNCLEVGALASSDADDPKT
ncbi:MAG: NfeD family protein [Porticoccaceae bacterium]|nr:NfeD family protein [Porticoccaceae bacterium]